MTLLGAFAIAAIILAAVGLYGVINYTVAQRTQELGIRAALGALPRDLMQLVIGQAAALVFAGVIFGVLGAFAARKLVASQLFGIGPTDVTTLLAAGLLLSAVALVATLVPTRRASRADPLDALRGE